MSKKMPPEFYTLLEEIQAIDFVINAIQQSNENTEKSIKLKVSFEQKFGPLMNFGRSYSDYLSSGLIRLGHGSYKI